MKFTVFTPTFNRKELLEKLYKSLQKQTFKDFEWLIVDDGSTDGTKEKVEEFLSEKKLEIKYYFKENGGKQRAYNFATEKANGELFICLDSDDEYVENGLEIILKYWKKYEKNSDIAGMGYLSTYPNREIIGSSFPEKEMISTQFEIYNKYGVKGDKGLMFRTEIIKKYKFPVFEDEKFITEAVVYNRICEKYKMVYVNEKIEIKEYQEDGLTAKYNNLLLKNPKGQALYHNEINSQKLTFKQKVLNNAVYYKFCKVAGYKFGKIFKESKNKLFLIFAIPVGEFMWKKVKL
ncbi:glycosyltransferase family 2 protein [Leptotrichia wadei]|uniref:glycosyltransferase family 2 protein n=1 Tax=Leptotrichia wadei TaxID=157687 RepID=UPI0028D340CD|nr:glycosyltransferase family 2 protein [Leptotrichia wadei]